MILLEPRNVNYALPMGVDLVHRIGVPEKSRAGDVLRVPVPVATVYARPQERVLHHSWRDANPFFHLVEALWMIAGRDDLKHLKPYVKRMADFSDDGGVTQPAAYGKRWRDHFNETQQSISLYAPKRDQLNWAVKRLRDNPGDRRVVIQMWDAETDIDAAEHSSKDVPCNLIALPWVNDNQLHLTVFCRSNDMVLGAYGANAVHFSFLLEYLAARLGLGIGTYTQISNNFHAYLENAGNPQACWPVDWGGTDPYAKGIVKPYGIFDGWEAQGTIASDVDATLEAILQEDLKVFFEHGWREAATKARWPFLRQVVVPMAAAHEHWKKGRGMDRYTGALEIIEQVKASDWRLAGKEWLDRKLTRFVEASDDGVRYE